MPRSLTPIVDFFFETGILAKTPRSGFHFLGSGSQSVAEHIARTLYVGYVLATMRKHVDAGKVLEMCLFHDLAEARTSDLNYVHQQYTLSNEKKAVRELTAGIPFGADILKVLEEFSKRSSVEAKLARDADQLEWILSLKEQVDIGNARAKRWIPSAVKRLQTPQAKALAKTIVRIDSNHWWFKDERSSWWVNRNAAVLKKRY